MRSICAANLVASRSRAMSLAGSRHALAPMAASAQTSRNLSTGNSPGVSAPFRKKATVVDLQQMYRKGKRISMVTAYDYPSACHVDRADITILLVGDSVAMVSLGHPNTLPVTVDEMLHHCRATSRGAQKALIVGDLPFGSYEKSPEEAYSTALRFLKEGNVDAVKLEGGKQRAGTVRKLVDGGIAVMGHVGLTPQSISVLGGFRAQGRTADAAVRVLDDALALQDAGAFAVVLECVPPEVGKGGHCSGQVLVYHDLLGMMEHPHFSQATPSFCKSYASVGVDINRALTQYREEVESGVYPGSGTEYSPYKLRKGDLEDLHVQVGKILEARRTGPEGQTHVDKRKGRDDSEMIKVY